MDTVGKRLAQARTARGLSLEDAAHATKVRPDKLAALEGDDYGHFPSTAYAKGFLQIYARFLAVDASDALGSLDISMPISVADYQYLSNAPGRPKERIGRGETYARRVSLLPLAIVAAVVLGGLVVVWMVVKSTFDRLPQDLDQLGRGKSPAALATPAPATPPPATPAPVAVATPAPVATPQPLAATEPAAIPSAISRLATPLPARPLIGAGDRDFIVRDATPPPRPAHEIVIEPVRTSRLTIRRDDPASAPIFEGELYRNAGDLKLRGARFYVQLEDATAVTITKNGQPVTLAGPAVTIE